jgi:hypothetical protein
LGFYRRDGRGDRRAYLDGHLHAPAQVDVSGIYGMKNESQLQRT